MKPLSKNSWLYRINYKIGLWEFKRQARGGSVSLCTLMSSSMFSILFAVMASICAAILIGLLIIIIGAILSPVMLLTGIYVGNVGVLYELLYTLMGIAIFTGIFGTTCGDMKVLPTYLKKNKGTSTLKDSYVVQYVKALKDKVCPIIDITED